MMIEIKCCCWISLHDLTLVLYLFELDLRVDVDVADLTVEGFVLQTGAFDCESAAVLYLSSRSRVGLDGPVSTASLQHSLVL